MVHTEAIPLGNPVLLGRGNSQRQGLQPQNSPASRAKLSNLLVTVGGCKELSQGWTDKDRKLQGDPQPGGHSLLTHPHIVIRLGRVQTLLRWGGGDAACKAREESS